MANHEPLFAEEIEIEAGATRVMGTLSLPQRQSGLVVVASEESQGEEAIARWLGEVGLGTLQVDLLSPQMRTDGGESAAPEDVPAVTSRWIGVLDWLTEDDRTATRPIGLFGIGSGAPSALAAAGMRAERVGAVVAAGGQPAAAGDALDGISAPTLLIAPEDEPSPQGGDPPSIQALSRLTTLSRRETVRGDIDAPEALEEIVSIARDWFAPYLVAPESPVEPEPLTQTEAFRQKD